MANAFDQFDPAASDGTPAQPAAPAVNAFDKFDGTTDAPLPKPPLTVIQKLEQTWPAQLAENVYRAITLPGDVATGKVNVAPTRPGEWSDEDEARLQLTNGAIADRLSLIHI